MELTSEHGKKLSAFADDAAEALNRFQRGKLLLQQESIFGDLGIPQATTVEMMKAPLVAVSELIDYAETLRREMVEDWLRTRESRRELSQITGISRPTLSRWQERLQDSK